MERLTRLLARECDLNEVARTLHAVVSDMRAPVVGAMQVTCSDESERECIEAFQRNFAEYLLPSLKFGERSVFRIANLGGRYEPGAVRIAEQHYTTAAALAGFKVLVVKINSHVCAEPTSEGLRFGHMRRYDAGSDYCGALHAFLEGSTLPFAADLDAVFRSGGKDRRASLLDERRVDPGSRSLLAAVANAGLQAARALEEIRSARPGAPTLFLVLPCVTLNRRLNDTEILCGLHVVDWRSADVVIEQRGLGDDLSTLRLKSSEGRVILEEITGAGGEREAAD